LRQRVARLDLDERRERADPKTATLRVRPAAQALDACEIDERLRAGEAVLHQADEIGPAGERDRAVAQHAERFGERARSGVGESVQDRAPATASASSTRARVSGACRTRPP